MLGIIAPELEDTKQRKHNQVALHWFKSFNYSVSLLLGAIMFVCMALVVRTISVNVILDGKGLTVPLIADVMDTARVTKTLVHVTVVKVSDIIFKYT